VRSHFLRVVPGMPSTNIARTIEHYAYDHLVAEGAIEVIFSAPLLSVWTHRGVGDELASVPALDRTAL
jgi:hypothetical protein